ncbi:hypothetical protein T069G_09693 [Trichoderma breve]|uniref:Uncharacterized protein n=1 Tax=Trichoderma breve TaxID=2034170 RepID=A0A9W9E3Y3_9HYPO|nr:hypothetical protein T069G_09693 [Trichoderma breve]KAJ4856325.1 hypothetical protein T069G_09693 [Trichoderma breve]
MALFGENNVYKGQTQPFPFPPLGSAYRPSNEYLFCRMKRCSCDSSIEYTTVHFECYQIFLRVCDFGELQQDYVLPKLWISTTWRLPWKNAFFMPASETYIPTSPKSLELSGQLFGVTFLHRLPLELVLAIWRESKDSLFWRCMSIIRMVTEFETGTWQILEHTPVFRCVARKPLDLMARFAALACPVTKVTIDQEGIKEVERLSCRPQYAGEVHSDLTFIVEEGASLHGIEAQLQVLCDGRLRLQTTQIQHKYPYIWNTPAPPRFSLCNAQIPDVFETWRLQVVNTQKIIGITFFFLDDKLYDLYIHDSDESNANALYEQLSPDVQRGAFWIYLPIGTTDRILVLGTRFISRSEYNVLVRMEKAGDVVIGRNCFFSEDDYHHDGLLPEDWPSSRADQ